MSSTLSEGVRVPDIGSVNWGADVNFNWGLLNTALANISGNVKTDVANTWTATQTFSETISGSIDGVAARAVNDEDGNNIKTALAGKQSSLSQAQLDAVNSGVTAAAVQQIGTNADNISALQTAVASKAADSDVVHLAGAETISGDKTFTGATATHNITPETDNAYSLGSSSLKWGSVYASTYYYGSTQWGLDQRNEWTADNIVAKDTSPTIWLKVTNLTRGTPPSRTVTADFGVRAANEHLISQLATQVTTNGSTYVYSRANDGTRDQCVGIFLDATNDTVNYRTASNGVVNLGDSSHKWKTLNGINPGALGMPSPASAMINISSSITNLDGTTNSYTPEVNGWLVLRVNNATGNYIYVQQGSTGHFTRVDSGGDGSNLYLLFPVRADTAVTIQIVAQSGLIARLYPCLGNV